MISANLLAIFYLISGILFILALRGLSSPETSRQGNLFGIIGMAIAITVTFLSIDNFSSGFLYVILFLLIGGSIGAFIAFKIPMTAMPELVAGFHSLVGLAAVFVAISSVIIVGAIIAALAGTNLSVFNQSSIFGFLAIVLAAINIFGGFLVTQRMLAMYKKKKKDKKWFLQIY